MSDRGDPIGKRPRDPRADRSAVHEFSRDIIRKLDANAHKAHWSTVSAVWLYQRLLDEEAELLDALRAAADGGSLQDVIDEAADVAAFAMMIADNARRLTRGGGTDGS